MLQGGLDLLMVQLGVTFTVDGVSGTFTGIAENPMQGSVLAVEGMREDASLSITFPKGTAYTPSSGDIITAKGQTWAVKSVRDEVASYVLECQGRSQ